nr:GNAT family N-acetyltransferase [Massilia sp. YIM B02443]
MDERAAGRAGRAHAGAAGERRPHRRGAGLHPQAAQGRQVTAAPSVTLRPVTRDNFEAVTDLELHPHQREYLASNSYSIAQASFYPNYHTRAIYAGEELVGFMMFVVLDGVEDEEGEYGIWRFMVDRHHQGRGLGRAALQALLDEIRSDPAACKVWLSYVPGNAVASSFYGSFGFVDTGIDEEGEMVAVLDLTMQPVA